MLFSLKLQTINVTESFYAPPVVLVTPRRSVNSSNANLSGSRCNAVTAWVEVSNTLQDDWAHSFYWRGLNTIYFLWFEIKCVLVVVVAVYTYFFFA